MAGAQNRLVGSVVVFVVIVDFWGQWLGVDEIFTLAPDSLKATLEPCELARIGIVLEFSEQTVDIGGVGNGGRVSVVDDDASCGAPGTEAQTGGGRGQHFGQSLQREQRPLQQRRRHGQGHGARQTGG